MRKSFLCLALMALPLAAAYTYLLTDSFASINTTNWQSNGTISGSTNGLTSAATNGGSVIYQNAITDGYSGTDVAYEVRATLKITASGGTFVMYSHASSDALTGPATQGSYYAVEFTPTLTSGGCTMAANHYRRTGGTVTLVAAFTMACKDGMTIRLAQRGWFYILSTSLDEFTYIGDSSIASGRPGFGARGLPSGNGISEGRLAGAEYVAPGTIAASSVRTALFDTRVDIEWPGVADDANGSGLLLYQVARNGTYMGNVRGGYFSDTTVSPGTTYTYAIYPLDMYLNSSSTSVTITTPASGQRDPRKVGVRPLGTYWGASPENIDLQSGNLSFSLPTVTGQGRGGTAVPFRVSYNSQNWRKDPSGTWMLGTDVGFGWGWKMLAGSLTPVYSDWYSIHHYVYTDSSGAEYDLDVNNSGIWRSKAGIFVEYDATAKRLYFPGGSFWEFDCMSRGTEADAGALYPTRMVDTNGNEIKLRYQGGLSYGGTNGSARVTELEDVRAASIGEGVYRTYQFTYNADAIPHLTGISSDIGDGVSYTLSYSGGHALNDPFSGTSFGTAYRLNTMTVPGSSGLQFAMEYVTGSLEMSKVTMPYGGTLEWLYTPKTLAGTRTQMEVQYRKLNSQDGNGTRTYVLYQDDSGDLSRLAHSYTVVVDASGTGDKAFWFNTAADYKLGLLSMKADRKYTPSVVNVMTTTPTWAQTANGNPYVSATEEIIDPGVSGVEKASKVEQTVNDYGNLTERKQYGYYTPGGTPPLVRTFTYNYLTDSNYTSRHIWNRLTSVTVQKPGGSVITLAANTYDATITTAVAGSAPRQHDSANYGTSFNYRGNVTQSSSPGKTVIAAYNVTGAATSTSDGNGHSATQTPDSNKNYAVPATMTAGSLSTSFSWNGYMAMTSSTAPNSATTSFSYDAYARPASKTAANGAVTTFYYHTSPNYTLATTGTRWTKSWADGFGRTIKVESGYNTGATPTTVSTVDTIYAPCACTPMGKPWKTSLPYAPGGTVYWTENVYDALGRTVQVIQPVNPATSASWGSTTYAYSGPAVTVTDPAGKWKKYENDALGNLVKVTEPRPGGGTNYETNYTYSELGQLLTVSMTRPGLGSNPATVTQTRTWVYDGTTQRLNSVTHPESGTTSFTYNTDGTLLRKTDQKGQKIEYTYDSDGHVTAARRYLTATNEDTCARVDYYYGSQTFDSSFTANATGRLAATATGTGCQYAGAGQLIEMYSYTPAGAVAKKRLRIVRGTTTVDKDVSYAYGSDGKLSTVTYPGYTTPFTYTYDLMDRPTKMTGPSMFDGSQIDHVKEVTYGTVGQMTSMKYLTWETTDETTGGVQFSTPTYYTENKTYNSLYQLTRQTTGGVDLEYVYSASANNGRITGRNNYVSGENVVYSYDELNRLVSASVSGSGGWGQTFTHDGFGNLWTQAVTKGTAPAVSLSINMATNRINSSSWSYDGNGNTVVMPVVGGGGAAMGYDVDNRLISWSGPSGGTEEYAYLSDNKRVWKKTPAGVETYYFYGAGGQKLATFAVTSTSPFMLSAPAINVYFGGKLIRADGATVVQDRLGSVVARAGCAVDCTGLIAKDYFPYGDEIGTATAGNQDKFGTYHRDATTGLDYADQRYLAGTLGGRFLSADPYEASGGASEPGSWNRYPYVGGDPINNNDRSGRVSCAIDGIGTDCGNVPMMDCLGYYGGLPYVTGASWCGGGQSYEEGIYGHGGGCAVVNDFAPGAALGSSCGIILAPEPPGSSSSTRQIPSFLMLLDMCAYPQGTTTQVGYTLEVQYQVLDQDGRPIYGNDALNAAGALVKEDLRTTSGPTIRGGGVWCPQGGRCGTRSMSPNGTFWDTISGDSGGAISTLTQSFTVGGVVLPILGFPPGALGPAGGVVNNITASTSGVTVNGITAARKCGTGRLDPAP